MTGESDAKCESCGKRGRRLVDLTFDDDGGQFRVCIPCASAGTRYGGCSMQDPFEVEE